MFCPLGIFPDYIHENPQILRALKILTQRCEGAQRYFKGQGGLDSSAVSLFVDWLSLSNLVMRRACLSCTQRRALSTSSHHQTRDSAVTHSTFNSQSFQSGEK